MGWYVTCRFCGATEKYSHPDCGCQQKEYKRILLKIKGSEVVDVIMREHQFGLDILTHYRKSGVDFYVGNFHAASIGEETAGTDILYECPVEHYNAMKEEESKESDASVDPKEIVVNVNPILEFVSDVLPPIDSLVPVSLTQNPIVITPSSVSISDD